MMANSWFSLVLLAVVNQLRYVCFAGLEDISSGEIYVDDKLMNKD